MKSRRARWAENVAHIGTMRRNAYSILVGKPEGKKPLGRHRHSWEDNIRMDGKIGCEVVEWIHLAWDRNQWLTLMNTVMNL
jgi:hypothetical protein